MRNNYQNMLKKSKIVLCSQTQENTFNHIFINQSIETYAQASFSVILSSAAFMVYNFPKLPHPTRPEIKAPHNRFDDRFPSPFMSLHPFFDEWVELLSGCFFSANAVRSGDTLYLKVDVCKEVAEVIKTSCLVKCESKPSNLSIEELYELPKLEAERKKLGWINCSTSQKQEFKLNPTVSTPSILLGQIYENQQCDIWNVLLNNIPTVEQLMKYDAIIIPGSGLSVLSKVPEIDTVAKNIVQAFRKSQKLKILGICYGHQLIAREFGAKIVKRKRYGGLENIQFDTEIIKKFPFLEPISHCSPVCLPLSEHHEDFVTTTTSEYQKLAVSQSCQNEALVSKDGRILSTQFHPEYNQMWAKAYTTRFMISYENKMLEQPTLPQSKDTLMMHLKACQDLRMCISKFL